MRKWIYPVELCHLCCQVFGVNRYTWNSFRTLAEAEIPLCSIILLTPTKGAINVCRSRVIITFISCRCIGSRNKVLSSLRSLELSFTIMFRPQLLI